MTQLINVWNWLRASLWLIPCVMSVAAFGLAILADDLDLRYHNLQDKTWPEWLIYQGDLDGARLLLSTVAGSMITVAGVSFSITMVALSLASSQFGPRLLMNFMRDTGNQLVLGTFVSTFLYCLLSLGNGAGSMGQPPAVSASIGLVLAIMSVFVLIFFIHHVSSTIRAEHVVKMVAKESLLSITGLTELDECNQEKAEASIGKWAESEVFSIPSPRSGYVQAIDEEGLIKDSSKLDGIVKLQIRPGKFITKGEPLAIAHAQRWHKNESKRFMRHFIIGHCRTDDQDPEYGISQLVEVAVRALSPGINDPHTAIGCIDWLASGLIQIADKPLKGAYRADDQGNTRLIRQPVDFQGLVETAFDQIRQNGGTVPAVAIHLVEALDCIHKATDMEERQQLLLTQARLVLDAALSGDWQSQDIEDLKVRFSHLLSQD